MAKIAVLTMSDDRRGFMPEGMGASDYAVACRLLDVDYDGLGGAG